MKKLIDYLVNAIGIVCITYCLLSLIKWALGPYGLLLGL